MNHLTNVTKMFSPIVEYSSLVLAIEGVVIHRPSEVILGGFLYVATKAITEYKRNNALDESFSQLERKIGTLNKK